MKRRSAKTALYNAMPIGVWVDMDWAYAKLRELLKNGFGAPWGHLNSLVREDLVEQRQVKRDQDHKIISEFRRVK